MSSIHAERAERWRTTPFMAEWLANAVEYCDRNKLGKLNFVTWTMSRYGIEEAHSRMIAIKKPPPEKDETLLGDSYIWNAAAVEFGISEKAVQLYYDLTGHNAICVPARVVPAPKRKQGESSLDWLMRRTEAILDGADIPDFDWQTARAIALSEADKVRDLSETWRTNPTSFVESLLKWSECVIPSLQAANKDPGWNKAPGGNKDPEYKKEHVMDLATKQLMQIHTVAHMTWSHAEVLFEDLATLGLTTASSIEQAYRKDTKLLWRLCTCVANAVQLYNEMLEKFTHVVSYSPHFRPYFKRCQPSGKPTIQKDQSYIEEHGFNGSVVDEAVANMLGHVKPQDTRLFENYANALVLLSKQTSPEEACKFSKEAYDEMGNLSVVHEFIVNIFESPFGQTLTAYARAKRLDATFFTDVLYMDPQKCNPPLEAVKRRSMGEASNMTASMCEMWHRGFHNLNIWPTFPQLIHNAGTASPNDFEEMWLSIDLHLWKHAASLDKPTEQGRVAKTFGLVDPFDSDQPPPSVGRLFRDEEMDVDEELAQELTVMTLMNPNPKKRRTHCNAVLVSRHTGDSDKDTAYDEQEGGLQSYPLILPPIFKMGRNTLKIFHRIFNDRTEVNGESKDAPKKGQIRWVDFERAMKRIGFTVIHTAGSSVRFDPPAQTARPITFHRPHPEPTMSPDLTKWVAARFNRWYGWTNATFVRSEAEA